jgi:D-psicose/D-tagatose/L-ribulose 3-epimerase
MKLSSYGVRKDGHNEIKRWGIIVKLAVSNIAWDNSELETHLELLESLGCQGVEIAPSIVWREPVDSSVEERRKFRSIVESYGLEVVGIHALLYSRPDLILFGSKENRQETLNYIKQLSKVWSDLGGRIMVFGSPRNRARNQKNLEECFSIATDFFYSLALEAAERDVIICIEPLGKDVADFITSSSDGLALVKRVDHPNFGLHLDIKSMISSGEVFEQAFSKCSDVLQHVHVGDPGLAPPGHTGFKHAIIGDSLRRSGYDKYVSIEMRRGFGPSREVITHSVRYVQKCYMSNI